jgi:hypothetical protein
MKCPKCQIDNPEGIWVGEIDVEKWDHFQALGTEDGRVNLDVPEMKNWMQEIDPAMESEKLKEDEKAFPFIMSSVRHMDYNANRLAKNTHRDQIAGTPLHRYIPCRVEPV